MGIPGDDEFMASADELKKDSTDLVVKVTTDEGVLARVESVLQQIEAVGLEVLEEGSKIAFPTLEQLAIAAIQGAIERRK